MAQREDPRDNQYGNRERSFGGQHEQRLESDADRQYGRDRDQGHDFGREPRESSDWQQHRSFRDEDYRRENRAGQDFQRGSSPDRPYGSQGRGTPGREYMRDEWQSGQRGSPSPRYGDEDRYGGRQQYGGRQDYGQGYGPQQPGGQQYGGQYGQGQYGRPQGESDWSERQSQQGYGGGRDEWQRGGLYSPGIGGGRQFEQSGSFGAHYGHTGGFSGFGRRERVPGATTQSMLLGQESGWDDRATFDSPNVSGGWYSGSYGQGQSEYGQGRGQQQSFKGRGPKGYERSDDRLREMICERLTEDPRIDASDITVEVKEKVVTLTGNVRDRMTKYHIEEVVEECGGVSDVNNQLKVLRERGLEGSSAISGGAASDRNAASGTQTGQQGKTSKH